MLTSAQRIVHYDHARRRIFADRLHRRRDADYLRAATRMLRIYRHGAGAARGELHRRVERVLEPLADCPPRRVAAFGKLLDDASRFAADSRSAASLRRQVFTLAAGSHPLVARAEGMFDSTAEEVRRRIAREIGRPWKEIEAELFADVIELQRLESIDGELQPADLLAAYNVAQTQALLFRATRVAVRAREDIKTIVRHAKLAGLMHTIRRLDDGSYHFIFDGPASALRRTSRYGVRFARMIPKLVRCRDWQLKADVQGRGDSPFRFHLSADDGLRSPLAVPRDHDSRLEAEILAAWQASPPDGWTLEREGEILHRGQQVFTPDFVLRRDSNAAPIFVELVGYWTPQYLQEKARRLSEFGEHRWILIVPPSRSEFASAAGLPALLLKRRFHPQGLVELARCYRW